MGPGDCTVRSNASWAMIAWDRYPGERMMDRHNWKHSSPLLWRAVINNWTEIGIKMQLDLGYKALLNFWYYKQGSKLFFLVFWCGDPTCKLRSHLWSFRIDRNRLLCIIFLNLGVWFACKVWSFPCTVIEWQWFLVDEMHFKNTEIYIKTWATMWMVQLKSGMFCYLCIFPIH